MFGLLWIAVSGAVVSMLFDDPNQIVGLELLKGIVFVLVSTGLLYLFITRHARLVLESENASIEMLQQSEQRFRTLVDGIHDHLIVLLDRRGQIITWNPGAEALTGYTGKEVTGKHFRMLFDDQDQASGQPETILAEASERGPVTTFGRRLRADGSSFRVRSTIAPVYDDDGEVTGFTKVTRDLTEALEHERALEKRVHQQTVIAEIGRRAIAADDVSELTGTLVTEIGAVLGADQVVLFCATGEDDHQIAASWSRREGMQAAVELPTAELAQLCRECEDFETAGESVLEPYPALTRQGFESAMFVRFGSVETREWCLTALFRRSLEMDDDDRHFASALARILQNTLARERAQREIRRSESKLSMIVDQLPALLWTVDSDLIVRSITGSGLRVLGPAANESVGKRASAMVPSFAAKVLEKAVRGTPGTYVIEFEGRLLRTWVEPMRSEKNLVGAVALSVDITEQEAARRNLETSMQALERVQDELVEKSQALERREREYRSIVETMGEGLMSLDIEGRLLFANPRFIEMVGYELEELRGVNMVDFFIPSEQQEYVRKQIATVLAGHRAAFGARIHHKEGQEIWIEVSTVPRLDSEGNVVGRLSVVRDVTEKREAEREQSRLRTQIEELNRIESLGKLAGNMAHEFNNVLMGIQPFTELIRRSEHGNEKVDQATDFIVEAVQRGRRVSQEILRFARPTPPERTELEVNTLLEHVEQAGRGVVNGSHDLAIEPPGEEATISADRDQLVQVFMNLMLNATDAMEDGGLIRIRARRDDPSTRYEFGVIDHPERYVHLEISDTGCGMPPEVTQKIFEPMFTTKRTGTGLGLAIVHQIVTAHQGYVFVESEAGEGTTFHLFFPSSGSTSPEKTAGLISARGCAE